MSATAEDVSEALSSKEPSLDNVDAIAELLVEENKPEKDEEEGDQGQTETSNLDQSEQSNEQDAEKSDGSEGEEAEIDVSNDDLTWGKVLGVNEEQLSFDDDGNLAGFVSKVNGEAEILTAEQLLAGYQTNKAVTTKGQIQAEEYKKFEVERNESKQEYAAKLESVENLSKHFEQQLIAEFDSINWDELRNDDPAEWAAKRQEYAAKAGELQQIQEAIKADKEAEFEENQKELIDQQQTYLKQQFDKMIENNPEWADEKVRESARSEFKTFVRDQYGFSDDEFESVFDARLIELIKDALKYHKASAVAERKRQKPVPQFQKSAGGDKKKAPTQLEKLTKAAKKATGANKRNLQVDAVAELLTGS